MNMKKAFWVLAILVISSLMLACVPSKKKAATEKRRIFGATYMNMTNPFFVVLDEGIREIVEAHGDKLISYDPASDQLKQIGQIEEFIGLGVDAIFLNPVDWNLVKPALEAARKAGIPVINVDAPVYDLDLVDCVVSSDNVKAGQLLAEDLLKRLPRARIAQLDHLQAKSAIDRKDGFLGVLASNNNYSVVSRISCEGNIEPAMTGMESILNSGARIDAVFATNDPMATGAVAALVAAGLDGKVLVYGVDGAPYAKKMIADGRMTATAAQSPVGIGREAADIAYRILAGEKVNKTILVPVFLIDTENVAGYGVEGWQ
ncbi:sugar ABC transporter substrate-binding protein [Treponema sp.]